MTPIDPVDLWTKLAVGHYEQSGKPDVLPPYNPRKMKWLAWMFFLHSLTWLGGSV